MLYLVAQFVRDLIKSTFDFFSWVRTLVTKRKIKENEINSNFIKRITIINIYYQE